MRNLKAVVASILLLSPTTAAWAAPKPNTVPVVRTPPYSPLSCSQIVVQASLNGNAVKAPWGPHEYAVIFEQALLDKQSGPGKPMAESDVEHAATDVLVSCLGVRH